MHTNFGEFFPDLFKTETRIFTIIDGDSKIPEGDYIIMELYCADKNCNCQRVLLRIYNDDTMKNVATISYGFKSRKFYDNWFGSGISDEMYEELKGPALITDDYQSDYANELLDFMKNEILADTEYTDMLKRHYKLVKEVVDNKVQAVSTKISRNDVCPCGSGKKYKKCCLDK